MTFEEFSKKTGVLYYKIPETFGSYEAFHIRKGSKAIIVYNDAYPENRLRFTLAHEYAHFVMEHEGVNLNRSFTYKDIYRVKLEEYEANTFASCLLFPLHMRYKYLNTLSVNEFSDKFNISKRATQVGLDVIQKHMTSNLEDYMSVYEENHPEDYINYLVEKTESELEFILDYNVFELSI